MALNVWRALCAALAALLLIQFYSTTVPHRSSIFSTKPVEEDNTGAWLYEPLRDSANIALSSAQCDRAFPALFYEVERAVTYWKNSGHVITESDIDVSWRTDASFKVLVHDNQLSVTDNTSIWLVGVWRRRSIYTLNQVNRALLGATAAGEELPSVEFAVTVGDMVNMPENDTHSIFAFTRRFDNAEQEAAWLIPDFNFFSSPPSSGGSSWRQMQSSARTQDSTMAGKIPKLLWRGVLSTNKKLRGNLLDATRDKEWADVEVMDWKEETLNIMEMDDFCRYMFLAHTEGRSYSSRLNYLLNCNSLSVVHDLKWTTMFYHLLVPDGPNQNYIAVKRDFSDLEEHINRYSQDLELAQRVADNAVSTFRDRYTSPAAESCYWRRLIQRYSEVAFSPEPFEKVSVTISGIQLEKSRLRGVPFEQVILAQELNT